MISRTIQKGTLAVCFIWIVIRRLLTRQGVWDNIRRAEAALRETEEKTGLIRRFLQIREGLESVRQQLRQVEALSEGQARVLAGQAAGTVDALLE